MLGAEQDAVDVHFDVFVPRVKPAN